MQSRQSFITRMQDHLRKNHFPYFPDEDIWGRRVEYDLDQQEIRFLYEDENQLKNVPSSYQLGVQLSQLHQASSGFPITRNNPINFIGKWPDQWFKRLKRIQKLRDQLYQFGVHSEFEELFLEDYTYFNQLAQVALFYLEDHNYQELIHQAESYSTLAYRSFSWDQVEMNEAGLLFINPENWILDIGVRDLGQFIRSSSMDSFNLDESIELMQGYQYNRQLQPAEYHMIYAQLLYPRNWISLMEKYMERQKYSHINWEVEIQQLRHCYLEWETILAEFIDRMSEEFDVEITPVEWLQKVRK